MRFGVMLMNKPKAWQSFGNYKNARCLSAYAQAAVKNLNQAADFSESWKSAKPFESVPGPSKLGLVRAFLPGGEYYQKEFLEINMIMREKYGDIHKWPPVFGKRGFLFTFNPDDIEQVFRTEGIWPMRRGLDLLEYYRKVLRTDVFKSTTGLIQEQGERWGDFRSMVNPVLMNPKTTRMYVPKMDKVAAEFVERVKTIRDPASLQVPQDFIKEINHFAMDSICLVALDTEMGLISNSPANPKGREVIDGMREFFELIVELDLKPSMWKMIATPKYKRAIEILDQMTELTLAYIDEAIARLEEAKAKGLPEKPESEKSILERLLSIDRDVAAIMAMDMFQGGVDTTSTAFSGCLLTLAKNPEKQEKLRQELRTILPRKDSPLTAENMHNLPYLRACIKEALRLYPVTGSLVRTTGQNVVLSGYAIPKNVDVVMPTQLLMTDPKHYARPTEFVPERWLRGKESLDADGLPLNPSSPFIFLPFGFGPRTCIGKRIVDQELETLLAKLVRNFEIRYDRSLDNIFRMNIINVPAKPLDFKFVDLEN